jgi:hypothetical protein
MIPTTTAKQAKKQVYGQGEILRLAPNGSLVKSHCPTGTSLRNINVEEIYNTIMHPPTGT